MVVQRVGEYEVFDVSGETCVSRLNRPHVWFDPVGISLVSCGSERVLQCSWCGIRCEFVYESRPPGGHGPIYPDRVTVLVRKESSDGEAATVTNDAVS